MSLQQRVQRALPADAGQSVREHVVLLTVARLVINSAYRFAPPFLATIASGFDTSLAAAGVALSAAEVCGLTAPLVGRLVDRVSRRTSMTFGPVGVALGALIAASAPALPVFAVGVAILSIAKIVFDVGLAAWIVDEVPYRSRGRVVGITETSWALGLLVGVTTLGLVTAATDWRWAYGLGATAIVLMATLVHRALPPGPPRPDPAAGSTPPAGASTPAAVGRPPRTPLPRSAWVMVAAMGSLMAASQCVFVSFGAWLEDRFGFGSAGVAAVGFGLGGIELAASLTSAGRADVWGKHRSAMLGCSVMVPSGALMWLGDDHVATGLVLLGVYLLGYEFGIVSAFPAAANVVPTAPGAGLGAAMGGCALGRAATSIAATAAYDAGGFGAPAGLGAGLAAVAAALFVTHGRLIAASPSGDADRHRHP